MMAPETPSILPLKSASSIDVSIVTGDPSSPSTWPENVNFANALMAEAISAKVGQGIFLHLLALGEESCHNNGARDAQPFAAEVGFSHIRFHGGGLLDAEGDRL